MDSIDTRGSWTYFGSRDPWRSRWTKDAFARWTGVASIAFWTLDASAIDAGEPLRIGYARSSRIQARAGLLWHPSRRVLLWARFCLALQEVLVRPEERHGRFGGGQ